MEEKDFTFLNLSPSEIEAFASQPVWRAIMEFVSFEEECLLSDLDTLPAEHREYTAGKVYIAHRYKNILSLFKKTIQEQSKEN